MAKFIRLGGGREAGIIGIPVGGMGDEEGDV